MIKVLFPNSPDFTVLSLKEFEAKMGIQWLDSLEFPLEKTAGKVKKRSLKAAKKKELNLRERWLGIYFQNEISALFLPQISIRWISPALGYGVFAEVDFPQGVYMGEYTGVIRKRKGREDRHNDYCFEYTIGDWARNPYLIDAKDKGNFTRFINHSIDPNLEPISVYAKGVMHICFITIRPIKQGEQLSYDYGEIFWKKRSDLVNTPDCLQIYTLKKTSYPEI